MTNAEDVESGEPVAAHLTPMLLKPVEAAKELGVGRGFMYELIDKGPDNGGVVSIRMARKILVPRRALEDWVTKRMQGGTDA